MRHAGCYVRPAFKETPKSSLSFAARWRVCGAVISAGASQSFAPADGFPKTNEFRSCDAARCRTLESRPSTAGVFAGEAEAFPPTEEEKTKLSALSAEFNTMKAASKLAVLISLGALASFASAKTDEQAYLDTCRKDAGVPVPIAVVSPSVSAEYNGATVELEFVVETTGKPVAISVKSISDDKLAVPVMEAVKQWRFKPAEADGKPVATKVLLPVKIVEPALPLDRFAAN
jgi:protein TonB